MFHAVRAALQRLSTLTVASVVALSSLATAAPLFFSQTATAASLGDVLINEIMANPATGNEWVELYNTTSSPIDISQWQIRDNGNFHNIPDATTIVAHGFYVGEKTAGNGLANTGETITLEGHANAVIDTYTYGAATSGQSFARNTDGSSGWVSRSGTDVTKGLTNNLSPTVVTPGAPTLVSPAASASLTTAPTNFTWTAAVDAVSYEIEFSTSSSFGAGVGFTSGTTSLTEAGAVPADGTYYWRVRGVSSTGHTGAWATGTFTVTTPIVPPAPADTVNPTITIKPANDSIGYNGVYRKISFKIKDNIGVKRWNINGGAWVNVTVNQYGDVNNKTVGNNGIVNGSNVITLEDASGNATSLTFYMNNIGPTITVKPSLVGSTAHQLFSEVDFALEDPNHIDYLTLNGVAKDLTNNQWSDLNNVKPGQFGAVAGANTLVVFDGIGNSSTYTFTLDTSAPQITIKSADNGYTPFSTGNDDVYSLVHFKLHDNTLIHSFSVNDSEFTELTPNSWSDVNNVRVGHLGAVEGWNTIAVRDIAGNESSLDFFLDGTAPTVSVKGIENTYTPESFPVESEEDTFTEVSFKLFDSNKIDKVTINGIEKDLSDDEWSDVNFVSPGVFGAQLGLNVLVAYDIAGNTTTYEFTLVEATTDPDNGQGGGEDEGEEESNPPAEEPVAPPVITTVLAVAQLITGANDGSRVLASDSANNSQTDGQVQAAETTSDENTVDGVVDEDDQKLVEDANSVFDYWWIVLLALIGLFWLFAAKRRKSEK